jgi:hypothetical protein
MKNSKSIKLNIIIFISLVIVFFIYLAIFYFVLKQNSICIFKKIFHFPCPTCGTTRAYINFFKGDIKSSFYYHPLFWLYPILGIIYIFRNTKLFSFGKSKFFWILMLVLFAVTYILRIIFVFKNNPLF